MFANSPPVPFAHARPEIRDPLNLLWTGRELSIPLPAFETPSAALDWAKAALLGSFEKGEVPSLPQWETKQVHCFYVILVFSTVIYWLRGVAFALLNPLAQYAVSDPKEKTLDALSPSERDALTKSKELLTKKYKKYVWHCFAYIVMISWGIRVLLLAPWSALNTLTFDHMSVQVPHHSDYEDYPALMHEYGIFSMLQLSWYVAGAVENLVHDRSRNDFAMMLLHHFLTILLIYGAFCADCHRCAVHITVCLDIGDIAMYYCKSFHLSTSNFDGTAKPGYKLAHLLHLAALTGIWIVTRLYFYGLEIVTMWVHNPFVIAPGVYLPFVAAYLKVFLAGLWILQLLWGLALSRMVWQQAREGEFRDDVSGDTDALRKAAEGRKKSGSSSPSPKKRGKREDAGTSADSSATEDMASPEKVAGPRRRL